MLAACSFVGLIGFWFSASEFGLVSERFLPDPWTVLVALYNMIMERGFLEDIWISIARVWGAFLASAIMAIPLGIWMSSYRIVGMVTEPIVDFIRYLPVPALVPLLIIWFGIGESSKIAVLWMGTFFQLVLLVLLLSGHQQYAHDIY